MIGVMGLHHFEGSQAEVGCLLARRYWGQRLMTEALSALLGFAHDIGLVRLEAEIDVGNARSERLFSG
ncbi:GNAT family N-acetyltransferase [Duganella sp. Leaf126]|uniref:GNAT family N-acetyltransferase n=1 Tax=Duganella sp. Leaf126 TaxID=1736266 RepID=UPI0035A71401